MNKWEKNPCCMRTKLTSPMNRQKCEQWVHNLVRVHGSTSTNWIWFWCLVCGLCTYFIDIHSHVWSALVSLNPKNSMDWLSINDKMFVRRRRPNSSHHKQLHKRIRWCYYNGKWTWMRGKKLAWSCVLHPSIVFHYDPGYPLSTYIQKRDDEFREIIHSVSY